MESIANCFSFNSAASLSAPLLQDANKIAALNIEIGSLFIVGVSLVNPRFIIKSCQHDEHTTPRNPNMPLKCRECAVSKSRSIS
jgi:hypothetical protein